MKRIISHNFDVENMHRIDVAREHGAYASLSKLDAMTPEHVVSEVVESGLRGRGGAGFPTGKKWSFIPRDADKPTYLVVNADESEPGTFKDRAILERDPHLLIEGTIIAAHALGARDVYVYFRGEYYSAWKRLLGAMDEARSAGVLKTPSHEISIHAHRGAGAYICGEETALLNSIEGLRGTPRIKPPFPAVQGLFGCPTIVNNVETLCALPFIVREGAEEYRSMGTPESPGTKMISVSGHINNPGVYEVEMGTPLASFLANQCGATLEERALKAVIPGGPSVPALTSREALGTRIDHESLAEAGSQLGSGGMIVMDETACMPEALSDITRFFAHESCGRCSPCREGSSWVHGICNRIANGRGRGEDLDILLSLSSNLPGRTICVFSEALATAVTSFVTKFREEFDAFVND
jgi:NADH-quinone oxidoreductase subunit F